MPNLPTSPSGAGLRLVVSATTHAAAPDVRPAQPTGEGDFVVLARQVRDAGLFQRTPGRSVIRAGSMAALLAGGWTALILLGNTWYQLLVAALLAVVFAQIGFFGHEVGHRQVFRSRRINGLVGLACANLGTGISYGYWIDKHDRHHGHPNQVGIDPDVSPGVFSWTVEPSVHRGGIRRLVARHQAVLFFPVLLLEGLNLHVASARALASKVVTRTSAETLLLAVHAVAYGAVVFVVLSPLRAVAFLLVQQGLFGLYLGCAFAPNHKGMVMPVPGESMDFLRRQVTTSRNVRGGRLLDLTMGGLNYQIEHHLFPTMPMANLRRCRPMVRAHCSRLDIDYCETGLASSYLAALRHLRLAGRIAGAGAPA